jgi:predicted nucleotidyltransferase component of viral defense system
MSKRILTPGEAFELRQALHVAVLDALMTSRRWEPGDLAFQGGTSLHLVHGSPRYSEDLDFLVRSSLKLGAVEDAIQARLSFTSWVPRDARLTVTKAKEGVNPHSFTVALGGPSLIGGVRVKVELWQAPDEVLMPLRVTVSPVRLAGGIGAGAQAFVPTLELAEIYADKVFALAARPYLKPRDVFDLHWLRTRGQAFRLSAQDLRVRLAAYPGEAADKWIAKAQHRRKELATSSQTIENDLRRWLPSVWPLDAEVVHEMVHHALASLDEGRARMREVRDGPQDEASR